MLCRIKRGLKYLLVPIFPLNFNIEDFLKEIDQVFAPHKKIYALSEFTALKNLHKKMNYLSEVFDLIKVTSTGSTLFENFLPKFESGKIVFREIDALTFFEFPHLKNAVAFFIPQDPDGGTIYFRPHHPLGVLTISIAHEMAHSIDENSVQMRAEINRLSMEIDTTDDLVEKEKLLEASTQLSEKLNFKGERFAYDVQDKIVSELQAMIPCFTDFINSVQALDFYGVYFDKTHDDSIIQDYNINRAYLSPKPSLSNDFDLPTQDDSQ